MKIRARAPLNLSIALFAAAGLSLGVSAAHAQSQEQMRKLAKASVQAAAGNARIASEVCGVDATTVTNYRNSINGKFPQETDFATDWNTGWKNAAATISNMQQMKTSSPKDYDQQKSATCSDMRQHMKS